METETDTTPVDRPTITWIRPKQGRYLAGVAAGMADHLGVPRWLIRIAFVVLTLWNGAGILLYGAAWLLMPGEGETEAVGRRWANQLRGSRSWIGLVLVIVAVAFLIEAFPFFDGGLIVATALLVVGILLYRGDIPGANRTSRIKGSVQSKDADTPMTTPIITSDSEPILAVASPPKKPPAPPSPLGQITIGAAIVAGGILAVVDRFSPMIDASPRHYLALVITILGAGLLVGAFIGRAKWLIVLGILLIPAALGAAVYEVANGRTGQVDEVARPVSFAALASNYEKPAGQLVIDLTDLPWNGEEIEITAEVGAGELVLIAPDEIGMEVRGEVGLGEFESPAGSHGGVAVDETVTLSGDRGSVIAHLSVGVGAIRVEGGSRFPRLAGIAPLQPGLTFDGDLVVDLSDASGLEPFYSTSQGDIVLDLSDITLEADTAVEVVSDTGDITVTLPAGVSYHIEARTETGVIDLFGEESVEGSVRADSISNNTPIITLSITSTEGDITLVQGGRS